MDIVKLGSFLKELRKEHGFTQEQLAAKLGVTNRTVSRWETGVNLPDLDILLELSELYCVDIKELLVGERLKPGIKSADTEMVMQLAVYSAKKEELLACRLFVTAVAGVAAVGISLFTAFQFLREVIGGWIMPLAMIATFLCYIIIMQAFKQNRSAVGYRYTLLGGFSAIIVSNISILWLFFSNGEYHNYGIQGISYILQIVIGMFILAGVIVNVFIQYAYPCYDRTATRNQT